jgi:transposase
VAAIVFEDKVFGCIDVRSLKFIHHFEDEVFNAKTYLYFLENVFAKNFHKKQVCYIQDNASYHKDSNVWEWFDENKDWLHVKNLPPYCPELNAAEHIWHHTRVSGIHNQYFDSKDQIIHNLEQVFFDIRKKPKLIEGYMRPFL